MFIDDVLASEQLYQEWPCEADRDEIRSHFRAAFVVRAQNVWEYFRDHLMGKERLNNDYPNVAPSLPIMWFEWVADARGIIDIRTDKWRPGRIQIGVLCRAFDMSELAENGREHISRHFQEQGVSIGPETRWCAWGLIFSRILEPGKPPHLLGRVDWRVGQNGELLCSSENQGFAYSLRPVYAGPHEATLGSTLSTAVQVCWLALSFMHCKNVQIVKSPPIPEKLRRARERKGREPLFRHHTVIIESARRVIEPAQAGGPSGPAPALHICRGHFKDFTERGLFGRQRGVYWWPMHVRGSAANGTVGKDYEVRP